MIIIDFTPEELAAVYKALKMEMIRTANNDDQIGYSATIDAIAKVMEKVDTRR